MKRIAISLLAASIGLGLGAAVVFAQTGSGRSAAVLESPRVIDSVAQSAEGAESVPENQAQPTRRPVAPCDPEAMLPVIGEAIQIPYDGMFWESVEIQECRNGYARVFAITGGTPPTGTQLEGSEQVFLQDIEGQWAMLSSGSGLDCYPGSMPPDLKDACEALGLP